MFDQNSFHAGTVSLHVSFCALQAFDNRLVQQRNSMWRPSVRSQMALMLPYFQQMEGTLTLHWCRVSQTQWLTDVWQTKQLTLNFHSWLDIHWTTSAVQYILWILLPRSVKSRFVCMRRNITSSSQWLLDSTQRAQSLTHALIRKAGDLFHCEQTGVYEVLTNHLKDLHPELTKGRVHLYQRYVGNRLNIMFVNAATLFFYKEGIKSFFYSQPPSNDMQCAVLSTLKSGCCDHQLQALGLVCKYITGPWQRLTERNINILELNPHFSEAAGTLRQWMVDPAAAVADKRSIFSTIPITDDLVYQKLTSNITTTVAGLFGTLCGRILSVMERQLTDQMPGECLWDPSPPPLAARGWELHIQQHQWWEGVWKSGCPV